MAESGTLEQVLNEAIDGLPPDQVTMAEIRDSMGHQGMMLLVVLLTIIFLVPVSVPGVSTVFGGAILLVGVSRVSGRHLWMPQWMGRRAIATPRLRGPLQRGLLWVRRFERVSRPGRLGSLTAAGFPSLVTDVSIIIAALLLMAPFGLIPLSNTLPAIALMSFAIGVLQRDGLCILFGHCANVATVLYFSLLIGGGGVVMYETAKRLLN